MQFDNLLWQAPMLALTAQAFLFTVALGQQTSRTARVIACLLSLVMSVLSITLMARHRQGELVDAEWLQRYEETAFPYERALHGVPFRDKRAAQPLNAGWIGALIPRPRAFTTWVVGLSLFGAAAITIMALALFAPPILGGPARAWTVGT